MTDFEGKSHTQHLFNFLQQKNLNESMGQLYRAACLAETIPVSIATVNQAVSA